MAGALALALGPLAMCLAAGALEWWIGRRGGGVRFRDRRGRR